MLLFWLPITSMIQVSTICVHIYSYVFRSLFVKYCFIFQELKHYDFCLYTIASVTCEKQDSLFYLHSYIRIIIWSNLNLSSNYVFNNVLNYNLKSTNLAKQTLMFTKLKINSFLTRFRQLGWLGMGGFLAASLSP